MQIPIPKRLDWRGRTILNQDRVELPPQLGLPFYGKEVSVDGIFDEVRQIEYMGKATHVFDDTYYCLAVVSGALCMVEVTISPHEAL